MEHTRLHALDAIRGLALLLGLVIHGSMSFWIGLVDYGFPFSDISKSMTLTYLSYVLHMFRMTVFFLIAGFFAHLSLHRKVPKAFFKDRMKRIALPMVAAWLPSIALLVPSALWAASKLYGADYIEQMNALQGSSPPAPFFMHFWFLYYLLWFYFIAVVCSRLLTKLDKKDIVMKPVTLLIHFLCKFRFLVIITTALSSLVLIQRENWVMWGGIPTPTEAIWNEAPAFFIYGLAFFIGWVFDRERSCFLILKNHWLQYFLVALVFTALSIPLLDARPFSISIIPESDKLIFSLLYSMASWCWVLALIGVGMKYFDKESDTRRYLADASYWIYIVHLPLIFFLQAVMMDWPIHWAIKFPALLIVATTILLWTYEHWVRYSFIGNILNGPRQRPAQDIEVNTLT